MGQCGLATPRFVLETRHRPRLAEASILTPAIVARGAKRHGAYVIPLSGCHEPLEVWVAGPTSVALADAHPKTCGARHSVAGCSTPT
jgi:hypothetical protein